MILWILKAKYAEDQYSVDFPQFSLLFSYFILILIIYIIIISEGAGTFNKFSGFDAGASVLKGRMELLC